uniref:Immune-related, lectin-like receptor 4 n=1 Tax=Sinocyclocheilus rhinocerous TaxID=307959 RepID=A0A673H2Z5_9TELE
VHNAGYYTQFSSPLKMIAHLKCNKLLACPKNWEYHAGKHACISDDGHLVIINSRDEQEFLIGIIKTEESFWIGLTDEKIEDQWLWVDNRNLCKDKRKEPDNWKGYGGEYPSGEDCAHIHKNSIQDLKSWFDAVCNKALRRICETRSSRQT